MLYGQISIDPEVMSGTPVFTGTRVPVKNLFDYMEGGDDLSVGVLRRRIGDERELRVPSRAGRQRREGQRHEQS